MDELTKQTTMEELSSEEQKKIQRPVNLDKVE